ncbi:MAG: bifunctional riboflavin kinase/FAD synthetase [Nannocystaceae bacterium]|nr:bifunctional riboflavin kinase/FAD synthetase [Nannocystaceae bacterium]
MPLHVQRDAASLPRGTAVCMGAFDGLHRGHQALIKRARTHAKRVALVTFDPHPTAVLAPERMPPMLHAPIQRERVAADLGVENLVLLPFDLAMSRMPPEDFVRQFFSDGLAPQAIVVGADFRFGARRAGTAASLQHQVASGGVVTDIVKLLSADAGKKVSSSDIRRALHNGNVAAAAQWLGRWHAVAGTVEHGAKRGRQLGFPTANLAPCGGMVPPTGIYASVLTVWSEDASDYGARWPAVTSVGHNPTFTDAGAPLTVETHVLDQALGERLYGLDVEVSFVKRLRDEQKFDGAEALVTQMHRDADQARRALSPDTLASTLTPPSPLYTKASP